MYLPLKWRVWNILGNSFKWTDLQFQNSTFQYLYQNLQRLYMLALILMSNVRLLGSLLVFIPSKLLFHYFLHKTIKNFYLVDLTANHLLRAESSNLLWIILRILKDNEFFHIYWFNSFSLDDIPYFNYNVYLLKAIYPPPNCSISRNTWHFFPSYFTAQYEKHHP